MARRVTATAQRTWGRIRNLRVRISGYNAYFVTLSRELRMELIERAEFEMAG